MTMVKDNYFRIIYLIIDYLYSQMKKAATDITGIIWQRRAIVFFFWR